MSTRKRQRKIATSTINGSTSGQVTINSASTSHATALLSSFAENASSPSNDLAPVKSVPLSAVAARKAAQAQQNAQRQSTQPRAVPSTSKRDLDSDSDPLSSSAESAASASSASEDEQLVASSSAPRLAPRRKRPPAPSRYYNAGTSIDSAVVSAEETQSPAQPDQDRDEQDLESHDHANATEVKGKMGRGKRQRREKSAFLDPSCLSNFAPALGENTHRIALAQSGASSTAYIFCLREDENLIVHGSFGLRVLAGQVDVLGATLKARRSCIIDVADYEKLTRYDVFAPSSHPLPVIHASSTPRREAVTLRLLDRTEFGLDSFTAVLMLTDSNLGIDDIDKVLQNAGMGCANDMWNVSDHLRVSAGSGGSLVWRGHSWTLITATTPTVTSLRRINDWDNALTALKLLSRSPPHQRDFESTSDDDGIDDDDQAQEDEQEREDTMPDRLAAIIEGPKRSGKSTFARMALNALLDSYEAVAYLDTDCGQPEFTPPGFVSLSVLRAPVLGPSFTHLTIPVASYYLGSTSPASDPSAYSAAIASLLSTYQNEIEYPAQAEASRNRRRTFTAPAAFKDGSARISSRVPLVVNTQGWVKGLGADLLAKLKVDVRPTRVFSFDVIDDDIPFRQNSPTVLRTRLSAAPSSPLDSKWSAADLRTLAFIAYFHGTYPTATTMQQTSNIFPSGWNFEQPLVTRTPHSIDWRTQVGQLDSVHVLNDVVPYEQVLHALNGSIVGLATPSLTVANSDFESASPSASQSQFPYTPSDQVPLVKAAGLGIVRSIDPTTSSLHLITPVQAHHLNHEPLVLVKGTIEIPIPLMLDYTASDTDQARGICGSEWKGVPYLSVDAAEVGGRRRVRRNLMRRGQA